MQRVSVVGNSGSGKSTLARELAAAIGGTHLELDGVFHQPGWASLDTDEFRRIVADAATGERWVMDGNYSAVRPIVWERADTVVWLDLPRRTVMRQIVGRTLRRVATREELWNGNREQFGNLLRWDPQESIISWAWHNHAKYRERYAAAASEPANAHLTFVRLTSRRDITRFLAESAAGPAIGSCGAT